MARLAFRRSARSRVSACRRSDLANRGVDQIRYLRSAAYPGRLTVELAPIHVGRTSFTIGYGIFDRDGCVAVAMNRSVCVDRTTGRPVSIQDNVAGGQELGRNRVTKSAEWTAGCGIRTRDTRKTADTLLIGQQESGYLDLAFQGYGVVPRAAGGAKLRGFPCPVQQRRPLREESGRASAKKAAAKSAVQRSL